jgi:hypothetical protein
MNKELARSCIQQISIWQSLLEKGQVNNVFFNNADYKAALSSLIDSLENELEVGSSEDDQSDEFFLHLIVAGNVDAAIDSLSGLRLWLKGAKKIIICDPYLFHYKRTSLFPTVEKYADGLAGILPASAEKLDVYSNSYTTSVRKCVMKEFKFRRTVRHFSSHDLHDRFIIKDGIEGKILGTSFGGFGRKFFSMIDLPAEDVKDVVSELRKLCPFPVGARR